MSFVRFALFWVILIIVVAVPMAAALTSPLLAWRDPVYIVGGFAGVFAMALLLFQPMLIAGYLPGLSQLQGRYLHRWIGISLVSSVVIHVLGLWITSPPDVIDALTFTSPTPFSVWGVIAMWGLFITAFLTAIRRRLKLQIHIWRLFHRILAAIIVVGSVVHAMLIEGTMEFLSKTLLCLLVLIAAIIVLSDLKPQI